MSINNRLINTGGGAAFSVYAYGYFYSDSLGAYIGAYDLTDPNNITFTNVFQIGTNTTNIIFWSVSVDDTTNHLYFGRSGLNGMRTYSIADKTAPSYLGQFFNSSATYNNRDFKLDKDADILYTLNYSTSSNQGVSTIDVSDPTSLSFGSKADFSNNNQTFINTYDATNKKVYTFPQYGSLQITNVSNPNSISTTNYSSIPTLQDPNATVPRTRHAIKEDTQVLFVADYRWVRAWRMIAPGSGIVELDSIYSSSWNEVREIKLDLSNNVLYATTSTRKLLVFTFTNADGYNCDLTYVTALDLSFDATMTVPRLFTDFNNDKLYIFSTRPLAYQGAKNAVSVIDITNRTAPTEINFQEFNAGLNESVYCVDVGFETV